MRPMTASLVLLVRNEIEGLRVIFPKTPFGSVDEIVAIDGHSTDDSVEYLRGKGIKVIRQQKLGRGNAMMEGVRATQGDVIVFLSCDGNEDPADILKLIEKLKTCDIAVASRFMKGGRTDDSDDPLLIRKWGNKFVTALVNLVWGANVTDSTNGLRGLRRSAWDRMLLDATYHETEFQMTIRERNSVCIYKRFPPLRGFASRGTATQAH